LNSFFEYQLIKSVSDAIAGVIRLERPFDLWCNAKRVLERALPVLLCGCPGCVEASGEGESRRHARDGDDDLFFHDL
jgi:hypothetical protein